MKSRNLNNQMLASKSINYIAFKNYFYNAFNFIKFSGHFVLIRSRLQILRDAINDFVTAIGNQ